MTTQRCLPWRLTINDESVEPCTPKQRRVFYTGGWVEPSTGYGEDGGIAAAAAWTYISSGRTFDEVKQALQALGEITFLEHEVDAELPTPGTRALVRGHTVTVRWVTFGGTPCASRATIHGGTRVVL